MIESIPLVVPYLHQSKVNNEIIGIGISLVLEKSREDITVMALGLVSKIAKDIGSDLTEKYFFREIFEISLDYTVNIGKAVVEFIAEAFKLPFADSLRSKLIGVFVKFMESENWNIRKHCISFFPRVYKNSNQSMQDLLLPLFCKSLKDKSKWVKEQSTNTCCCVLVYSKIPIPNEIIKYFLKVSDSGHYHAAYYFPGVLLTLGSNHWPDLKKLLTKLSDSDIRTKTCVVKSFHEIAKILGAEVTGKELVDLYEKFLDDEEVRFTAWENLPNFLREIFPEARDKYKGIVKGMGREREWRSRNLLAKTLCEYIGVYDYNCIYSEIWPLALELCEDLHCTVRLNAAKEVAKLAMYLLSKNSDWRRHIEMCIKKYAQGSLNSRIVFLKIVKHFAGTELAADFTEEILNLSKDKVKNVRIMCAEAVNFSSKLDHVWSNAKEILLNDEDQDVLFEFGRAMKFNNNVLFVTPPIMRRFHNIEVGGIVKFSHANPPKFAKIEDFEDISQLVS